MNEILQYEQGYISFATLEERLWDFGNNMIHEIGEERFKFYIHKSCGYHEYDYYIKEWDKHGNNDWDC